MALSLARVVNTISRKAFSLGTKDTKNFCYTIADKIHFRVPQQTGNARSLVTLSNRTNHGVFLTNNSILKTTRNGYASLHTEGDRRFSELLNKEISDEKKRSVSLPKMSDGWNVSLNGAEGTLTKTHDRDQIEVSFTLNGSLPPIEAEDEIEDEEQPPVVSYPEFNVKVTKPGNPKTVEFECYFAEEVQSDMADESMSMFSIRSAIIYEGEISDGTYVIDTENLNDTVYSYFLSYLADRSIDQQFAGEFVELATGAEQHEYIRSLQSLKDFVSSK